MAKKRNTRRESSTKRSAAKKTSARARAKKTTSSGRKRTSTAARRGTTARAKRTTTARAKRSTRTTAARGGERRAASRAGGQRKRPSGGMLSKSTQRAKWIAAAGDHEDRPGQTLATRDHDVIRRWAEERGGEPATVARREGERPRTLRFNFPGYGGANLEAISWDEWLRTFDERDLVFLFQEHMSNGRPSNFFRLDSPQREAA